jgi:hypothetical protein
MSGRQSHRLSALRIAKEVAPGHRAAWLRTSGSQLSSRAVSCLDGRGGLAAAKPIVRQSAAPKRSAGGEIGRWSGGITPELAGRATRTTRPMLTLDPRGS